MKLSDLSPFQVRMLARMAGPFTDEDATGVEAGRLTEIELQIARRLVELGLAEVSPGWGSTTWFALTDKGRKVRETGEA